MKKATIYTKSIFLYLQRDYIYYLYFSYYCFTFFSSLYVNKNDNMTI